MIQHLQELKNCKTISDLQKLAIKFAGNDKYANNFREALFKEKDFNKALIRTWNFALQKEGKYYLGKVGYPKIKSGGAITGLECHSEGHR